MSRHLHPLMRLRRMPLRWHLALLIAGTLLPVIGFSAGMILRLAQQERTAIERRLQTAAENMADVLDARMEDVVQSLEAMALSPRLDEPTLEQFHDVATRVLSTQPGWVAIIVLDAQGRKVMSTTAAWDGEQTPVADPESVAEVLAAREPVIGRLVQGMRGDWAFPVRVPVLDHAGALQYVLTAVVRAGALNSLVALGEQDGEWTRTLVDDHHTVVARTVDPGHWVGTLATPRFIEHADKARRGLHENTTLEGRRVLVAFDHSRLSNWTTVVASPREYVDAPVQRSVVMVAGLGLASLLLSLIAATLFARRVTEGIESAASAARSMAEGGVPDVPPSGVAEIAGLSQAIRRTSRLLRRRERERDEQIARTESAGQALHELNATLEQRVARRTAEAEHRAVQLRALASQLATAEDRERRRVAQTLHDDLQQVLVAAKMRISTARSRADDGARRAMTDIEELLDNSIRISRSLTSELSPLVLYDLGLPAAVEWLARHMRERHGMTVHVEADADAVLDDEGLGAFLLNAARELLFNVVKHAGVKEARIRLRVDEQDRIELTVIDHGLGVIQDGEESDDASRSSGTGLGLFGIRERLIHLGGQMEINSTPEGETRVQLLLPRSSTLQAPDP